MKSLFGFYNDLEKYGLIKDSQFILNIPLTLIGELFEKWQEIERQQIIDAYSQCGIDNFDHIKVINRSATEYYDETYRKNITISQTQHNSPKDENKDSFGKIKFTEEEWDELNNGSKGSDKLKD